ncbi:MAG: acyl--CoA ligase [Firmicutes bacterium]|nr:acyl--CoA ligase [Bacillota bacterium]
MQGTPLNFGQDIVDTWAQKDPASTALYVINQDGHSTAWSFGQIREISNRTAWWLKTQGIGMGDRVLVVLGKDPSFWPVMVALNKLGAVPMPGTTQLTTKDLWYRLDTASATRAIVLPFVADRINEALRSPLEAPIVIGKSSDRWISLDPFTLPGSVEDLPRVTGAHDPALIYFTSGTTGYPKMVLHDQSYPFAHRITAEYWLGLTHQDLHWNVSDTGWAKAAWSSLFGPWVAGAGIVVDPMTGKFSASDLLKILQNHPITSMCAPPTVYRLLIQEPLAELTTRPLRSVAGAGEPLNPEVISAFSQATGLTIRDGYGQTETVLLVGNAPGTPVKPGSMGIPAPDFEMDIIDSDGLPLAPGQEGDIAIKTLPHRPAGLFVEYLGDPEGTKSRMIGNYYITGDRAYKDEDGYFWFMGRADDVIISSGYRIGPFEVESLLIEHPAVIEAAVVSSPDPIRGEIVKAFVVLKPGIVGDEALIGELQEHVKTATAPYKYPRRIEFVSDLPKTISGKIRRVELRQREWADPQ